MNSDWVAASVRARAMARRRAGAGACRQAAARADLRSALQCLDGSAYAERWTMADGLEAAQDSTLRTVLWQLRVLAGWLPASGTRLLRAVAAGFERENILGLVRGLDAEPAEQPSDTPEPFELGALATAWPRLRGATSPQDLVAALRRSPWGDPGDELSDGLADVLLLTWLRELAAAAPRSRTWAVRAAALMTARVRLVDGALPAQRLRRLARPLVGEGWASAEDLDALVGTLPPTVRPLLSIETPRELWRAEARAVAEVERESFALLRTALPGPELVLGAVSVLAVDAWRVRAALAAADAGGTAAVASEVLDAVA